MKEKRKRRKACFVIFVNHFSYSADWCVLHWGERESSGYEMVVGEWGGVSAVGLCSVAVHGSTL